MGHPGAPDHDHHRSIWFAHNKVLGIDFWGDRLPPKVRQLDWLAYVDADDEAIAAMKLGWFDGHDPSPLMEQELVAAVRPGPSNGETILELQTSFKPNAATLELAQTNFGFLAVRVAKNLSARFGGGRLTGADGKSGEPALFGVANPWMDYSGPVPTGGEEGIAFLDHPSNVSYPSKWHVRDDGWMGASVCRDRAIVLERDKPLTLRYLLYAHAEAAPLDRIETLAAQFHKSPGFQVVKGKNGYAFTAGRKP
jgi:hypothetical protein